MYIKHYILGSLLCISLYSSSCFTHHQGDRSEGTGVAIIRLTRVPDDAVCLRITVEGDRNVERFLDLTIGQNTVFTLQQLPLGIDIFTGFAYAEVCDAVNSISKPTWFSDPVETTLEAGVEAEVILVMHRNVIDQQGSARVTVDFLEDAGSTDEDASNSEDDAGVATIVTVANLSPINGYSVDRVESMNLLDDYPNILIVATVNIGATCGGGTPATIWRITINDATGIATSVIQQQTLNQIQELRRTMFESSDGTLFTGSGWCGFKPPYYSVDQGMTWMPATNGTYPPNSTFSYAEFLGNVYVGTGYAPYHAQVYRWLGNGSWQLVFDIPPPRTIVDSLEIYQNRLFVAPHIYGGNANDCVGSVPVYMSTDGISFQPTIGIPECKTVRALVATENGLFAFGHHSQYLADPNETRFVYKWETNTNAWSLVADGADSIDQAINYEGIVYHQGLLYGFTTSGSSSAPGLYRSQNGSNWSLLVEMSEPDISAILIENNTLFMGTQEDADGVAHIYSLKL